LIGNRPVTRLCRFGVGADGASAPGITRFDAVCGPQITETVLELSRRWAEDRGLSIGARAGLLALVRVAIEHGLRFAPRGVTLLIGWLDPDHVRLVVRWHGRSGTARASVAANSVGSTLSTLDRLADDWGVTDRGGDAVHWVVFDTR